MRLDPIDMLEESKKARESIISHIKYFAVLVVAINIIPLAIDQFK